MPRHFKRAIKRTSLWALAFSLPLGVLLYFRLFSPSSSVSQGSYGEVAPFYFSLGPESSLTNFHLRQATSLVLLVPPTTSNLGEGEREALQALRRWAENHLKPRDDAPPSYQLLVLSAAPLDLGSQSEEAWQPVSLNSQEELKAFLPAGYELQGPTLVLIDTDTLIRAVYELGSVPFAQLTSTWARLTFNHYLSDYLSKRTFFGPKRSS